MTTRFRTLEVRDCAKCGKETPLEGKHCMHCGRVATPPSYQEWRGTELKVAEDADFGPLMVATVRGYGEGKPVGTSVEAVRWALSQLTVRQCQVLIRRFNLDNACERSRKDIAQEFGRSESTIRDREEDGLRWLRGRGIRQVLLGEAPIPEG